MSEQNLNWKDWFHMSPTLTHFYGYSLIRTLIDYVISCRITQRLVRSVPFQVVVTVILWGLNRMHSRLPLLIWFVLYLDNLFDKFWLKGILDYLLKTFYFTVGLILKMFKKPTLLTRTPPPRALLLDNFDQLTATPQTSGTFDVVSVDYKTEIRDKDGILTTPLKRDIGSTVQTSNEASISNEQ
ncbi:hypothetical protein MOUN0_M06766 [Monosporozyma unispora]